MCRGRKTCIRRGFGEGGSGFRVYKAQIFRRRRERPKASKEAFWQLQTMKDPSLDTDLVLERKVLQPLSFVAGVGYVARRECAFQAWDKVLCSLGMSGCVS